MAHLRHLHSPVTTASPAGAYWGLELSFHYGDDDDDTTPIMYTNAGILDTGTSLIYIASGKVPFIYYSVCTSKIPAFKL